MPEHREDDRPAHAPSNHDVARVAPTSEEALDAELAEVLRQLDVGQEDTLLDNTPIASPHFLLDDAAVLPESTDSALDALLGPAGASDTAPGPDIEEFVRTENDQSVPETLQVQEDTIGAEFLATLQEPDPANVARREERDELASLLQQIEGEVPEASTAAPPVSPAGPTEPAALPLDDLEALFASIGEPTDAADLAAVSALEGLSVSDASVLGTPASGTQPSPESGITQDDLDALFSDGGLDMSSVDLEEEADLGAKARSSSEAEHIDPSMIEALIRSAQGQATAEDVGSENLAAAATVGEHEAAVPDRQDPDAFTEHARQERQAKASAAIAAAVEHAKAGAGLPKSPAPAAQDVPKVPEIEADQATTRLPTLPHVGFFKRYAPRIAASLLAGTIVGSGVYLGLRTFEESIPPMDTLGSVQSDRLRVAMDRAQGLMDVGDYTSAQATLWEALAGAPPSPLRDDADFLLIEARVRGFRPADRQTDQYLRLQGDMETLIERAPRHARVPEVLYWKAKLYEMDQRSLFAARDMYHRLLSEYPDLGRRDAVLLDAARLALGLSTPKPAEAYQLAQRLLTETPGSPLVGEARLIMADAYAAVGQTDDARTLYLRTAEANQDNALGAEAYLRVAQLAYDERKYQTAVEQLESRLARASTTRGNDEVYLLLGRAQRRLGMRDAARDTLTDLLNFFPESKVTPQALIELSQILFESGSRDEAVRRAQEAVVRFPANSDVQRNLGHIQGMTGNSVRAAQALLAADEAGANDPALLLTAARHYRAAGRGEDALKTYDRLRRHYPIVPESVTGGIEAAQLLAEAGRTNDALERLEGLERATKGAERHVAVLTAMLDIYAGMGIQSRVVSLARKVALEAIEPADLAKAVTAMGLAAVQDPAQQEALDEAVALYERIDTARLTDADAHRLAHTLGRALLRSDPGRGLQFIERAHLEYPAQRTRGSEIELIEAYLQSNRVNDARRMVMEIAAQVREKPTDAPYLIDAAVAWGDHLYRAGDYRLAADAFNIAVDAASSGGRQVRGTRADPAWAKFQRANALLNIGDYAASRALFEEIASSNSQWSEEAGAKAKFAHLEEQRRGLNTRPAGPS